MKTIVTGGSGFLGSTVAQTLLRQGHEVTLIDRLEPGAKGLPVDAPWVEGDVRDADLLAKQFQGADEVYHLAGVLGTAELQETLHEAIDINIGGTVTVFEQAVANRVGRVFYPGKPNVWLNTYTITKAAAEDFGRMFNESQKDTSIVSLRYFNAYGPGQALLPIRKILPAFAIQAHLGLPLEIWGDGEQIVDMIFSRDLADLTIAFTRTGRTDLIPDCGSGIPISVNDVAVAVNEYFGNTAGLRQRPMRAGEVPATVLTADTAELTTAIGSHELTPWKTALAETLDWYAGLDRALIDRTVAFYGWGSQ